MRGLGTRLGLTSVRIGTLDNARVVRRETDDVLDRLRVKVVGTPHAGKRLTAGNTLVNVDNGGRVLTPRLLGVPDTLRRPERGQRPVMRLIVADHHDSAIRLTLDRLGLLGVRVLRHERHDTTREIGPTELRLTDGDDVATSGPDSEQNLSLSVQILPPVKPRRLGDHQGRVVPTLNVRDHLTQRRLLRPVARRVAMEPEPLDDRDTTLGSVTLDHLDLRRLVLTTSADPYEPCAECHT